MAPKALLLALLLAAGCAQLDPEAKPEQPAPAPEPGRPLVDACDGAAAGPCPFQFPGAGSAHSVAVHPLDAKTLAVAAIVPTAPGSTALEGAAVDVSHDGGATWTRHLLPFAGKATSPSFVGSVQVAIAADGTLGALVDEASYTEDALYLHLSRDGGATWQSQAMDALEGYNHLGAAAGLLVARLNAFDHSTLYTVGGDGWVRIPDQPACDGHTPFRPLANGTGFALCGLPTGAVLAPETGLYAQIQPIWLTPGGNLTVGVPWALPHCIPIVPIAMPPPHAGAVVLCAEGYLHVTADLRDGSFTTKPVDLPVGRIPESALVAPDRRIAAHAQEPDGTLRLLVRHDDGAGVRLEELRTTPGFDVLGRRNLLSAPTAEGFLEFAADGGWMGWRESDTGYEGPARVPAPLHLQGLAPAPPSSSASRSPPP